MADLYFVGSSQEDIKGFPKAVRVKIGYELHRIKMG